MVKYGKTIEKTHQAKHPNTNTQQKSVNKQLDFVFNQNQEYGGDKPKLWTQNRYRRSNIIAFNTSIYFSRTQVLVWVSGNMAETVPFYKSYNQMRAIKVRLIGKCTVVNTRMYHNMYYSMCVLELRNEKITLIYKRKTCGNIRKIPLYTQYNCLKAPTENPSNTSDGKRVNDIYDHG
jgi:hypothetical protein